MRGYQTDDSYQAYYRFEDSAPRVYAAFAETDTTTLSLENYVLITPAKVGSNVSEDKSGAVSIQGCSLMAAAVALIAYDQLF